MHCSAGESVVKREPIGHTIRSTRMRCYRYIVFCCKIVGRADSTASAACAARLALAARLSCSNDLLHIIGVRHTGFREQGQILQP